MTPRMRWLGVAFVGALLVAIVVVFFFVLQSVGTTADSFDLRVALTTPGLAIAEVETELCAPLEEAIESSLHRPTWSEVREGECTVHATLSGPELDPAMETLRGALSSRDWPELPTLARSGRQHVIWILVDVPRDDTAGIERGTWLDAELVPRIDAITGVTSTELCGPRRAREALVDPAALDARGVTLLETASERTATGVPGAPEPGSLGVIRGRSGDAPDWAIGVVDAVPIRLSDVATIRTTTVPRACLAARDGAPITALRVSVTASEVERALPAIRARLAELLPEQPTTLVDPPITFELRAAAPGGAEELSSALARAGAASAIVASRGDGLEVFGHPALTSRLLDATLGFAMVQRPIALGRIWVRGSDAGACRATADRLRARLDRIGVLVAPAAGPPRSELVTRVDRERAAALGVRLEDIARTFALAVGADVPSPDGEPVRLRLRGGDDPDILLGLSVRAGDGTTVPLASVVDVSSASTPTLAHRRDGAPATLLVASADRPMSLDAVRAAIVDVELPVGVSVELDLVEP